MRLLVFIFIIIQCFVFALPVYANSSRANMLSSTGRKLEQVYDLIEAKKLSSAKVNLNSLIYGLKGRSPDVEFAERALGYIYLQQQDYRNSLKHLKVALTDKVFSDSVFRSTSIDLAQVYFALNQYKNVVNILKPLLLNSTTDIQASKVLGAAYIELGRYSEAIKHLEKVFKATKKVDRSLGTTLVAAYSRVKMYKKAILVLERLLVVYPNDQMLLRQIAQMYYLSGNPKKGAARYYLAYEKGLVRNVDDIVFLAFLQSAAGSPEIGVKVLDKSLSSQRKAKKDILQLYAQLFTQSQNHGLAGKYYEKIYNLTRNDIGVLTTASQLYFRSKQYGDANRTAKKVMASSGKGIRKERLTSYKLTAKQILEQVKQVKLVEGLARKSELR